LGAHGNGDGVQILQRIVLRLDQVRRDDERAQRGHQQGVAVRLAARHLGGADGAGGAALLSTTTVPPIFWPSSAEMVRAIMSVEPPGGNGTMMVTVLVGRQRPRRWPGPGRCLRELSSCGVS
jgi:hypothetical protein